MPPPTCHRARKRLLLILALAVLVIGGVWWWQRPPPDLMHNGYRLSELLATNAAPQQRLDPQQRVTALHAFGPIAIPRLTYLLEHGLRKQPSGPFHAAPDWIRRLLPAQWGGLRSEPSFDERVEAARALYIIGPEASPAIPALVRALKSEDRDTRLVLMSAHALESIGPAAWPPIWEALDQDGPVARRSLLEALYLDESRLLGTDLSRAAAVLVSACQQSDHLLLVSAVQTIGKIRREQPDTNALDIAIPELIRLLSHTDQTIVEAAAKALRQFPDPAAQKAAAAALATSGLDSDDDAPAPTASPKPQQ